MRSLRTVLAAVALLAAQGCFEPPVLEILLIDFGADGGAVAALEVQLADPATFEGAGVRRRIADRESALLSGADPWLERFDAVESASDSLEWRRTERQLRSFSRSAEVDDPAALGALFAGDAADWSFERSGGDSAVELVPSRASRASKRERDRTLRELDAWAVRYAAVIDAALALDRYATGQPTLAGSLWRAALTGESKGVDELGEEERALARALGDRLVDAAEAFDLDPREGSSLSERVRDLFHPFSARLGIRLPCVASEVEGFVEMEERGYMVPELALWEAIERLEGRWLVKDPLRALLEHVRAGGEGEIDLAPFVDGSIATGEPAPGGEGVGDALVEQLTPPAVYRLAWSCDEGGAAAEVAP